MKWRNFFKLFRKVVLKVQGPRSVLKPKANASVFQFRYAANFWLILKVYSYFNDEAKTSFYKNQQKFTLSSLLIFPAVLVICKIEFKHSRNFHLLQVTCKSEPSRIYFIMWIGMLFFPCDIKHTTRKCVHKKIPKKINSLDLDKLLSLRTKSPKKLKWKVLTQLYVEVVLTKKHPTVSPEMKI